MKEHLKSNLMSFFIIVTLVNIAIFVCGIIMAPEEKFGYSAFIVPVTVKSVTFMSVICSDSLPAVLLTTMA